MDPSSYSDAPRGGWYVYAVAFRSKPVMMFTGCVFLILVE